MVKMENQSTAELESSKSAQDSRTPEERLIAAIESYVGRPLWPIEEENLLRQLKEIAESPA